MIGDTKFDIIGARNNLVRSIGVTYGHGSLKALQKTKADSTVNSCLELLSVISNKIEYNRLDG